MNVTFDVTEIFTKLGNLNTLLTNRQKSTKKVASGMMAATNLLVAKCFDTAVDPYGVPWAPLKLPPGSFQRRPFHVTDQLKNGMRYNLTPDGFEVLANRWRAEVNLAKVHQGGARITTRWSRATAAEREADAKKAKKDQMPRALHFFITGQSKNRTQTFSIEVFSQKSIIPARPFFPDFRGLPEKWKDRYRLAVIEAYKDILK